MSTNTVCNVEHPFYQWIANLTGVCIQGHIALVSQVTGMTAVLTWWCAGIYQIWLCYSSKRAEGFSLLFLVCWLAGDFGSVAGCVLTGQMTFQKVIACSSMLVDALLLFMFVYYNNYYDHSPEYGMSLTSAKFEDEQDADMEASMTTTYSTGHDVVDDDIIEHHGSITREPTTKAPPRLPLLTPGLVLGITSVGTANAAPISTRESSTDVSMALTFMSVGQLCAWFSQIFYFTAGIPQIMANHHHKSTGNMCIFLFVAEIIGNGGSLLSILLSAYTMKSESKRLDFLQTEMPYIIGNFLAFMLAAVVIWQFIIYWNNPYPHVYEETLSSSDSIESEHPRRCSNDSTKLISRAVTNYLSIE